MSSVLSALVARATIYELKKLTYDDFHVYIIGSISIDLHASARARYSIASLCTETDSCSRLSGQYEWNTSTDVELIAGYAARLQTCNKLLILSWPIHGQTVTLKKKQKLSKMYLFVCYGIITDVRLAKDRAPLQGGRPLEKWWGGLADKRHP